MDILDGDSRLVSADQREGHDSIPDWSQDGRNTCDELSGVSLEGVCDTRRHNNGDDQVAGKKRYSVEYGPILFAAVGAPTANITVDKGKEAEHLANHLEPVYGAPLHFSVRGNTGQKFMPYWQISEEEFTCYPEVTAMA